MHGSGVYRHRLFTTFRRPCSGPSIPQQFRARVEGCKGVRHSCRSIHDATSGADFLTNLGHSTLHLTADLAILPWCRVGSSTCLPFPTWSHPSVCHICHVRHGNRRGGKASRLLDVEMIPLPRSNRFGTGKSLDSRWQAPCKAQSCLAPKPRVKKVQESLACP